LAGTTKVGEYFNGPSG